MTKKDVAKTIGNFPSNRIHRCRNVRQRCTILKKKKKKENKNKKRLRFVTSFIIFPLFHGLGSRLRTDGWIFQRG